MKKFYKPMWLIDRILVRIEKNLKKFQRLKITPSTFGSQRALLKIGPLLIAVGIFLSAGLVAQENQIRFKRLTIEDGLSQSSVLCILQDSKGFMWFGTEDGLNRYDGYNFKVFKSYRGDTSSLSDNSVWSIYEDHEGVLWVGTLGGLNRFDRETEKFTRYINDPNDPNSLSHNVVRSIIEDSHGVLWIGTEGGGLNRFDREKGAFRSFRYNPDNSNNISHDAVFSLCEEKPGVLWVGTLGGLDKFDTVKESFTHYRHNPNDPKSLSDNRVYVLYKGSSGVLWVGTQGGGLNRFNQQTETFTRYKNIFNNQNSLSDDRVYSIYEDYLGEVWVATQKGLNIFDPESGKFRRYLNIPADPESLSFDYVVSTYEDRSGLIWVGTKDGGVNIFDRLREKFKSFRREPNNPRSLSQSSARAIYEDKSGMLWIGTELGGLNQLNQKKERIGLFTYDPANPYSLSHNSVYSIYEDRSGTLWIGTYGGGLNRFDRKTGKFKHFVYRSDNSQSLGDDRIRSILEDHKGQLWIGTDGGGLNKFDRETEAFTRYQHDPRNPESLSHDRIFVVHEGQSTGALWVGTFGGGLNKFNPKEGTFKRYLSSPNNQNSLSNDFVIVVYEDKSGILWIGTNGGGLNKFDPEKGLFSVYTEKDGLASNAIYGIVEDTNGYLWISGNKGLSRFNPQTGQFRRYDVEDGLQSNEFNGGAYYKTRSGEIIFGGINGFSSFFADRINDNPYIPQVVITDFRIFNNPLPIGENPAGRSILKKSITETGGIQLSYKDRVISFEFASLHYAAPEKNEYSYMLEGFEREWNHVGNRRFATYTNLPPGRYVFRVKGSNNDGVWNKRGAAIRIQVTPPFWLTPWFRSLAVIFFLAIIFTVYKVRTKAIRERNKKLEIHVEERTSELRRANLKLQDEIDFRITMERELKRLKEFNESIVQNMAEGIVVQDVNGYHTFVNPSTAALLEYKPEEIIGLHWKNIVPLDQHHIVEEADKLRAKKQASRYEVELISKSGKRIPVQISGNPIFNDGNFVGSVAVFTDISEIKRVEEEKRHREAQNALIYKVGQRVGSKIELKELLSEIVTSIRNAFSYYGVMLLLLDEAGKYLHLQSITGGYAKIYSGDQKVEVGSGMIGYAAASGEIQVSGDVSQDPHYCRWENEETKSELSVPIKSGDKVIGVLDIQSDDYNAFDETDVRAMRTLATQIASAIDNARLYERAQKEIAERKRAEEALKIEKSYLDQLFDSAQEAIVVTETNGRVLRLNPEFTKLFGYTPDEALGRFIDDLVAPEDYYKSASAITKKVESGEKASLETVRRRKDGTLANVILLVSPIVIDGKVEATYAIYRDISLRIRAEEKLKQTAEELLRSNKELELFAYIASHDLQEPLRMVASYVQLLARRYQGKLDSDAEAFINYAVDGAARMQRMINDLLIYSRVGTKGKLFTPIEVEKVFEQATSNLQIAIEESKAVVTHDPLPLLLGDETQLVQLFQNLIGNAIKFRENHQEPYIYVSAEEKPDEWLFLVRDNGIGIDPQYYERIFQIFQRLHGHKDYPGSGIGLAVCRRIVERHGGRIWVDSQPGKGSTFYFTIPKRSKKDDRTNGPKDN